MSDPHAHHDLVSTSTRYGPWCCRERKFVSPETNPHCGLSVGQRVSYENYDRYVVVSTQALNSSYGMTLEDMDTGAVRKVFGVDRLRSLVAVHS